MSAGTAASLALDPLVASPDSAALPADALSRREATLRAAATVGLAGVALVQTIGLPSLLAQGRQFAVLSIAAIALCLRAGFALVLAPASASRRLWRMVAATAVLVLAGWAVPHAVAIPGLAAARRDWAAMPGAACGALAAACLSLAAAAMRPRRTTPLGVATALAVLVALGPGTGTLLVAIGPGPADGETAISADVHVHAHAIGAEPDIVLRRGRTGNHYLTPVARPPRTPAFAAAFLIASALVFLYGSVGYLRRRSAAGHLAGGPRVKRRSP